MNAEVANVRNEIVRKFCRTILWIDDGINLQEGLMVRKPVDSPLFWEKLKEFSEAGLLCHLQGFPLVEDIEGDDPFSSEVGKEVEKCAKLALQADIVIVDWMLGSVDSSKYAQEIVRNLLGDTQGFRFVVILSQKPPERGFPDKLDSTFAKIAGDAELWKNKTGQVLLSLRKDAFANTSLFDCICKALQKAYPDYLHLAALEIAGRIKDYAPSWLSAIPSGSDLGILFDRGNKMGSSATKETWRRDIQDCVVSNLLEDLSTVLSRESFCSLREDVLLPSNHPDGNPTDVLVAGDSGVNGTLNFAKGCLKDVSPAKVSANQYKALSNARKDPAISEVVKGVETYAEFCEKISNGGEAVSRLCTGAVYEGLVGDATTIAVCITGACDCERAQSLLFLKGVRLPESDSIPDYDQIGREKGGKTILRFAGKTYIFRAVADSLVPKQRADLDTKKPKGVFRHDIVNRLVGRYINYIRRIGVNQPEVARWVREEGDADE